MTLPDSTVDTIHKSTATGVRCVTGGASGLNKRGVCLGCSIRNDVVKRHLVRLRVSPIHRTGATIGIIRHFHPKRKSTGRRFRL